jgi:UTP--glucose-1-phosphate uridylyltransferase
VSDGAPRLKPVRYGVIPAGGLGTRFLPISRTVPKELLPIIDTPVIELVVAEMAAAGITRVVIVNAPGKEALDAYFRPNERLEKRLAVEFRKDDIALLKRPERLATVRVVIQEEAKGNGHAVLQARALVGAEPFAMLWGDDIVVSDSPAVAQLMEARQRLGGGSVVGTIRVSKEKASAYGVVAGTPVDERTQRVLAIVEKPKPEDAPSEFAAVHGYVLEPEVFDVLERAKPGRNGEIWLTDAVSEMARQGAPVWAVELQGRRYDTGDRVGYVNAFIEAALRREDIAPLVRAHLKEIGWRAPGER